MDCFTTWGGDCSSPCGTHGCCVLIFLTVTGQASNTGGASASGGGFGNSCALSPTPSSSLGSSSSNTISTISEAEGTTSSFTSTIASCSSNFSDIPFHPPSMSLSSTISVFNSFCSFFRASYDSFSYSATCSRSACLFLVAFSNSARNSHPTFPASPGHSVPLRSPLFCRGSTPLPLAFPSFHSSGRGPLL